MAESKQVVNEAKLIIVGNSHVGKSTLSYLLRNGKLPSSSLASTHGLEFSTWQPNWQLKGRKPSINIIDFGGQEYYHDTHHLFFNDKAAYLLLWDPETNVNKRMDAIRHFTLEYWLNAIEIYAAGKDIHPIAEMRREVRELNEFLQRLNKKDEDTESLTAEEPAVEYVTAGRAALPPVLLVQTHADRRGRHFLNLKDLQAKYEKLAGSINLIMDVQNAQIEGFDMLTLSIQQLYTSLSNNFGQEYLQSWVAIRNYIEQKEKGRYLIMNTSEFRGYFLDHTETKVKYSREDIRSLCITLDYWGVVLYRYEKEELADTIIVNPQHFIQHINILFTEKIREKNGVITEPEVIELLKMDANKAKAFLSILITFKILFRLPVKEKDDLPLYISPMYLQEKPGYVKLFIDHFVAYYKIRYDGYFHKGILLDCFRELGKDIYFERQFYFYWQWGMVLKRGDRIIAIEFDEENLSQIMIRTTRKGNESLGKDAFLREILGSFRSINRQYRYELELSANGVHFVSKEQLLKVMEHGINKFDWQGEKIDARDLFFLLEEKDVAVAQKRVFVSYSSRDRDYLDKLAAHLALYKKAGIITYWDDLMLHDRDEWNLQIKGEMENANVLIMLLSPESLSTDYILFEEIPIALAALAATERSKRVFWILLRPCSYEVLPHVAKYPIYPLKEKDVATGVARQKAISEHEDQDREWVKLLGMIFNETE